MERETRYRESNYPTGTWESIWINLILRATEEWRSGDVIGSYFTTIELFTWLPLECKKDVEAMMNEIKEGYLNVKGKGVTLDFARLNLVKERKRFLGVRLIKLQSAIQSSLETHGWISKPVGSSPQIKHKKEAWA